MKNRTKRTKGKRHRWPLLVVLIGLLLPAALSSSSSRLFFESKSSAPSPDPIHLLADGAGHSSLQFRPEAFSSDPTSSHFQETLPEAAKSTASSGQSDSFQAPDVVASVEKNLSADTAFLFQENDLKNIGIASSGEYPSLGSIFVSSGSGGPSPRRSTPPTGGLKGNDHPHDGQDEVRTGSTSDGPPPNLGGNPLLPPETQPLVLGDTHGDPPHSEGGEQKNSVTAPEPSTLLLFGLGLVGFLLFNRQKAR